MIRSAQARLAFAAALAGTALQGCSGMEKLNILAAIDGPYISPSEREAMAREQAALAQAEALARADEPVASPVPAAPASPALAAPAIAEPELAASATPVQTPPQTPLATTSPPGPSAAETAVIGTEALPVLADPALTSVGPDFLPPEITAPAAPIPASVSTAFIGPVLTAEEPPAARLQTQLPSAFDYVASEQQTPPPARRPVPAEATPVADEAAASVVTLPASALAALPEPEPEPQAEATGSASADPLANAADAAGYSVVSTLPSPATPAARSASASSDGWAYLGFYQFALSKLGEVPAGGARESMLLLDPPSLDPELQKCGNLPPAVLIDLDPANGLLPLVSSNRTSPELAGYLADLRRKGVTIYWISGHAPNAAGRIRQRLRDSALDPDGIDPLIVTRFAGESKQERRYALGESHCLLAILGDHRGDFDELYDFVLDPIMAGPLEVHVGDGWFIAPPPLD